MQYIQTSLLFFHFALLQPNAEIVQMHFSLINLHYNDEAKTGLYPKGLCVVVIFHVFLFNKFAEMFKILFLSL